MLEPFFALTKNQTIFALCTYGFNRVGPCPCGCCSGPRDYISSFLKIGTIALLVVGQPSSPNPGRCRARRSTRSFASGRGRPSPGAASSRSSSSGVMCGSISGFSRPSSSSGTTPKMINKGKRRSALIGYGSMLIEGLVGVVAPDRRRIAGRSNSTTTSNVDLDKAAGLSEKTSTSSTTSLNIDRDGPPRRASASRICTTSMSRKRTSRRWNNSSAANRLRGRTGGGGPRWPSACRAS